jgi:hypothetical protein
MIVPDRWFALVSLRTKDRIRNQGGYHCGSNTLQRSRHLICYIDFRDLPNALSEDDGHERGVVCCS